MQLSALVLGLEFYDIHGIFQQLFLHDNIILNE